jgi:hypothetical protein
MDVSTTVRAMLDAAGFDPPADEVAELEREYLVLRQMVDLLYSVDTTRYEYPCLIFDANPQFLDWSAP